MDDLNGRALDGLLDELLDREGGYVDHPADRGGPTRYGCYSRWPRRLVPARRLS